MREVYMRVSIAAEGRKTRLAGFSHVSADASGPREGLKLPDRFFDCGRAVVYAIGPRDPVGRGLRPELIPPHRRPRRT